MQGSYDIQQVCKNGHQINDSYKKSPQFNSDYCDKCGEKTITECEFCNEPIRGRYTTYGVIDLSKTRVPNSCHKCGKPYPWFNTGTVESIIPNKPGSLNLNDSLELAKTLCRKFHRFARQLQSRHSERDTIEFNDEYDVQDAFHAILKLHFNDIRVEEYTPSYAGSNSRIDFLLHEEEIAIEIKKTRSSLKAKEVGEQIAIDIQRYKPHPQCKKLLCFVYDPEGKIGNPSGLEKDLTMKEEHLQVITIICPKGL